MHDSLDTPTFADGFGRTQDAPPNEIAPSRKLPQNSAEDDLYTPAMRAPPGERAEAFGGKLNRLIHLGGTTTVDAMAVGNGARATKHV